MAEQQNTSKQNIYEISIDNALQLLDTSSAGLTSKEAQNRLEKFGPNEITEVKKKPLIFKLFEQFYHTFAIMLWIAAALCFYPTEQPQLGYAIIGVIVLNALFSFYQEAKAEKAVEALKKLLPKKARVIRDKEEKEILAAELVPGDVVLLSEGDSISADGRVIEQMELRTDNSTLTGESEPVRKSSDPFIKKDIIVTHAPNLVFAGTSVAFGNGRAVVFATGMKTEFGKIATLTQGVKEELSPLQKDLQKLIKLIATVAVASGILLLLADIYIGNAPLLGPAGAITLALGLIVANVPEGLLPMVTLGLALGVSRLAQKRSIVKKLSSVETLGSTSVICTDKTGTLTQNEMTVREIWANGENIEVTGAGYEPSGEFLLKGEKLSDSQIEKSLDLLLKTSSLANDAKLQPPKGEEKPNWTILGDPTEASLLVTAVKGGLDLDKLYSSGFMMHELPFESVRKRMAVIYRNPDGSKNAYVKGAPKETLDLCTKISINGQIKELDDKTKEQIVKQNDEYALKALRVLAMAYRPLPDDLEEFTVENTEKDLIFVGLMAMYDPPRPEVEAAVNQTYEAGIKTIMITGDYGLTAEAIARKIGLVRGGDVLIVTGAEINNLSDRELKEKLEYNNIIFARVAPEHKMRIVSNLKEMGKIVAVTGDGVNDAPALKESNIGVAMGITGTDVSKEAAEMIITDDNFATIVNAIEEGRTVFDNLRKFIGYIFGHLTPEVVPFIAFVFFASTGSGLGARLNFVVPLAITVMLILGIDLATDTFPALGLAAEPPEPGIMSRKPRPRTEPILTVGMVVRAWFFIGAMEATFVMSGFFWELSKLGVLGKPLEVSDPRYMTATAFAFMCLVFGQIGNAFSNRTRRASLLHIGFFSNKWILFGVGFQILALAAIIHVPGINTFFGTKPLGLTEWLIVIPIPIIIIVAEEIRKLIIRKYYPVARAT